MVEVTVIDPSAWLSGADELGKMLAAQDVEPVIGEARADAEPMTVVDPAYWSAHVRELSEVLVVLDFESGVQRAFTQFPPSPENRLTMSVEEAAEALGISRAFAYEAVRRNEIPHIRIGKRILIPKAALQHMLEAGTADTD